MVEKTYTTNEDGTISVEWEGQPTRFAKESDLLAVKGASKSRSEEWETEKAQFNTQMAEANRLRDETHQSLLQERATLEKLQEQYKDYETHKVRVGELETEVAGHKETVGKHQVELTERIRQNLITTHGAHEDALKDKTFDQLRNLEEAAKVFGSNSPRRAANYDGGGPTGGSTSESQTERAMRIIEEAEARQRGQIKVSAPQ